MAVKKATKKTTKAVKVEAPKTEEPKTVEVVAAPKTEEKAEEVVKVAEAPKTEEKVAEVKETTKKAPAKKTAAKKTTAKKAEVKAETEITLEFGDYAANMKTVEERVKAQYAADGNDVSAIKTLNIYVKPFENAAYYVVNAEVTGRVDLF